MIRSSFILAFCLLMSRALAQPLQTLRGSVTDKASDSPVAFAKVVLLNTQPLSGAITDTLGNFSISDVPVGRYDIKVSRLGYEDALVREVVVSSARQMVLSIRVTETPRMLEEVSVKPSLDKNQPLNAMATVSARMLSVEEAKRYAGGFDDPARLASAFAGVAGNSGNNGIIVRGNAPKYLQWKMEGVEIPNPNHFGDLKAFGGGVLTGLSSQMLANSDFFTGAFPAEYTNALSGVLNLSMRKGNQEKREHTIQLGLTGIETSSEGPFKKGGKASYLYNYRNSTLALLEPLLPDNAETIRYQDLSFKMSFPTNTAGIFTVWGIGLADGTGSKVKPDSTEWLYDSDRQQDRIRLRTGAAGISHRYFFNNSTYIHTTFAATGSSVEWKADALNDRLELTPFSRITYTNRNYILSSYVNKKLSARHTNKTGITLTGMNYNTQLRKSFLPGAPLNELLNASGFNTLMSAYSSSSFRLTERLVMNLGVSSQFFTLNGNYTVEPRLGFRQSLGKKQSLGIAYGLHSRLESLNYYYNNSLTTGERAVNKKLDFTKAHHLVLSYDRNITEQLHLRIEPYFQQLFNVPVMADSSFSIINLESDWFFAGKLQNTGEGRNYGVDLTLERYMSDGYYYLLTASVFDSKYKGGDGIWRDSRFNRRFVANVLIGKEWQVGRTRQNVFSVNTRLTYQGGNRYSPVNEEASVREKRVIYDATQAFSRQAPPAMNIHVTVSYKLNRTRLSHEFALKILNLTGQPDFYGYKYNYRRNSVEKDQESVLVPNLSYRIEF